MSIEDPRAAAKRFYAERVDPIISWPAGSPRLAPMIAEMQRLNPGLGLRCAISKEPADEDYARFKATSGFIREPVAESEISESLLYTGTALDVVMIAMPEPPDDDMMSGLTEVNRESYRSVTDLGTFRFGPRRIERTADGSLLIRPRSRATELFFGPFVRAYRRRDAPVGEISRISSRYGIYHDPYELWEVDFSYVPEWVFGRAPDGTELPPDPRSPDNDHDFWRIIPIGTVSYIDRHDLPLETHFARAREIVALGAEFAIVGDVEAGELHIFRMSGVVRSREDVRLPELYWFDVPVKSRFKD